MSQSLLSQLFAPLTDRQFLEEHWPGKVLVSHGPLSRIQGAESLTLDRLLDAFDKPRDDARDPFPPELQVWFTDESERGWHTLQRKAECFVNATAAKILHQRKGGNLACYHTQKYMPEFQAWCDELTERTGNPTPFCVAAYASPAGAGIQQHFDRECAISLQLVGTKKWYFAENQSVRNPTRNWMVSNPPVVHPDLERQLHGRTFPQTMPEGTREAILEPGSVLFIPPGWWHKTETSNDFSFSISFQACLPDAASVITTALLRLLHAREEWREPIPFLMSDDPDLRSRGLERLRTVVGNDIASNPLFIEALLAASGA